MKYKKIISKALVIGLCLSNISTYSFASNLDNHINIKQAKSSEVGTWQTDVSSMPTDVAYFNTEVIGDKIYIIGGEEGHVGGGSYSVVKTVYEYDTSSNTWNLKSDMPTARKNLTTVAIGSKIYCIGGELNSGSLTSVVEVYDTVNDAWETKTPMPIANANFSAAIVDNKIYCIGGSASTFAPRFSNDVYEYDVSLDKWTKKASVPANGKTHFVAEAIGEKIYCVGGMGEVGSYDTTLFEYDTIADTWDKTKTPIITGRSYHSSVVVDGEMYCIGGANNLGVLSSIEAYNPQTNRWSSISTMPTPRQIFSSEYVNGKIYCIGGFGDNSGLLDSIDVYTLKSSVPTIESNAISNNADVYIKMANTLSLSLDTNIVTFEDFSGVEDMEKKNAINLTVESSLPYEVNASLETEIQNLEGTNIVDKGVLGIKSDTESSYNVFTGIQTPIILLDNQQAGEINVHGIDLKLNKNIISKADVYKTTLKFEVKQK